MFQNQPRISDRLEALYRRAASAIADVERRHGASPEAAEQAGADFYRGLIDDEARATRELPEPTRRQLKKGLVQVYTGDGKGKTTAAFGLAARAVGAGLRVCMIQFLKGGSPSGEIESAERLPRLKIIRTASSYNACENQAESAELRAEARSAFERARLLVLGGEYDLVILDEINIALFYKFVTVEEALELIQSKPESVELIFTGRYAPEEIQSAADLVTRMESVKHPAEAGISARKGIDF